MDFNSFKSKYLYNIYLSFMAITIIGLFIYFRFIIKRATYSLEVLKIFADYYYFCICFFFLILHLIIIIIIIYNLCNKDIVTKNNKYLQYTTYIIDIIVWKPLYYILKIISPHIPYSGTIIIHYCYFFRKDEFRFFLMKLLCFFCYFFPKIVMSILFVTEIIFYHQLKYSIQFIYILLIPLIYKVFINLAESFYTNNMPDLLDGLIVTVTGTPNSNGVYATHHLLFKENSGYSKEQFPELVENWSILVSLLALNNIIRIFMQQLMPYITILCSSLYLIAFSYKIYFLFLS